MATTSEGSCELWWQRRRAWSLLEGPSVRIDNSRCSVRFPHSGSLDFSGLWRVYFSSAKLCVDVAVSAQERGMSTYGSVAKLRPWRWQLIIPTLPRTLPHFHIGKKYLLFVSGLPPSVTSRTLIASVLLVKALDRSFLIFSYSTTRVFCVHSTSSIFLKYIPVYQLNFLFSCLFTCTKKQITVLSVTYIRHTHISAPICSFLILCKRNLSGVQHIKTTEITLSTQKFTIKLSNNYNTSIFDNIIGLITKIIYHKKIYIIL